MARISLAFSIGPPPFRESSGCYQITFLFIQNEHVFSLLVKHFGRKNAENATQILRYFIQLIVLQYNMGISSNIPTDSSESHCENGPAVDEPINGESFHLLVMGISPYFAGDSAAEMTDENAWPLPPSIS
jgi:hypothetical protein